jgi:molybdenum cofactor synthesis domain-containing protein
MHGASIAALNMYDMLKPIDKQIEISSIKLLSKKGGKSSRNYSGDQKKALVLVCSDRVSSAQAEDVSGRILEDLLRKDGVELLPKQVVADEITEIQEKIKEGVANADIVLITGGTGLAQRDRTPEALLTMLDTRIPGIEETMRNYGQQRNPLAMLSRSVAGLIDQTLILAFPGSTKGVADCYKAVFPGVFHLIDLIKGNPKH